MSINPVLKVLLDGLYDEGSNLSKLRGCQHLMRKIWRDVKSYWIKLIELPSHQSEKYDYIYYSSFDDATKEFLAPITNTTQDSMAFPEPSGININMMPFIVGESWEQCKLPDYVDPYWEMIQQCIGHHCYREHHHMWNRQ